MGVSLIVITGFQVYWLRNNYNAEKRSLEIRTGVNFQETVRHLQMEKLNLKDPLADSSHHGKMKVFVNDDPNNKQIRVEALPRREIIAMVNSLRDKLRDSFNKDPKINSTVIISVDKNSTSGNKDSLPERFERRIDIKGNRIFQFLYGVDSLQDSLKIAEISKTYSKRLKEEKIDISFAILRSDSASIDENDRPGISDVTVGFVHPVTYKMMPENTFPYLLKKIRLPILFSIFLVGITILSFVLLYRNLLKQQRLAELKNEFISNITHELKTPIATVGVAIEALKSFNAIHDPQRTKEYLDISQNELQRLNLLVDKVLKLSMFEKKEIDLKYEMLNLKDVLDEVVASLRLQIEKHHAQVLVNCKGDCTLQADRLHLLSVIFNLLDNALKYSKGNPVIKIDLEEKENSIVMKVADNGIGILPEYQDKVFDKFFRIPHGDTHNAKGYGLGLSYVAHVVTKHKGTIDVESKPGEGTTFTISLPKKSA